MTQHSMEVLSIMLCTHPLLRLFFLPLLGLLLGFLLLATQQQQHMQVNGYYGDSERGLLSQDHSNFPISPHSLHGRVIVTDSKMYK